MRTRTIFVGVLFVILGLVFLNLLFNIEWGGTPATRSGIVRGHAVLLPVVLLLIGTWLIINGIRNTDTDKEKLSQNGNITTISSFMKISILMGYISRICMFLPPISVQNKDREKAV